MKRKIGITLTALGLLLIAAALCLIAANLVQSSRAAMASQDALEAILAAPRPTQTPELPDSAAPEVPDYVRDPDMEMPTMQIDGRDYIGVLEVPTLELSLPVLSQWSYPLLQKAPCRFVGSIYKKDMIIMAHNYPKHFGKLRDLHIDDQLYFTDAQGNVFAYKVTEIENLDGDDVDALLGGQWDLTLFTCTTGGKSRVTIRCEGTNMP